MLNVIFFISFFLDDDLESNVGVSDASEEDFSCNFDDMEDVKRTVTHLQNVIFERKRNIKSVQQKNRRLIKKIRRLKGDINEYAEKHCFNLDKSDTKSVSLLLSVHFLIFINSLSQSFNVTE